MVRIARGMVETYSTKPCLKVDYLQKKEEHCKEKKRIQVSQGNEFYFKESMLKSQRTSAGTNNLI